MKTPMTHRSTSRLRAALLGALCLATAFAARAGSPPVITGVTAAQQPYPSKLVDIAYTLSDPDSTAVNVSIFVSKDSGASWTVPALSFQGTGAPGNNLAVTATPTAKTVVWDAGADWNGHFTSACRVRVVASDNGLVGIPAGTVTMGDQSGDGIANAPVTAVTVSAFQMDSHLVTGSLWNFVKEGYADTHGYAFDQVGSFKAPSHPVHAINWYDAVKWCNARSEMGGKDAGVLHGLFPGCGLSDREGGCDERFGGLVGQRLPAAHRGGVGKGRARRSGWPSFPMVGFKSHQ